MRPDRVYLASAAVGIGLLLVFVFQGYYARAMPLFVNIATPVVVGGATLAAFAAVRRYGLSSKEDFARAWQLFLAGTASWFLAEVTWSTYALVLGVPLPYPSLADPFYIAGYALFAAGWVKYVKVFSGTLKRNAKLAAVGLVALAAVLVSFMLTSLVFSPSQGIVVKALDVLYPMLDLVVFGGAMLGLAMFRGGRLGTSWLLINMAVVFSVVADLVFSYMVAQGTYAYGTVSDLIFLWGYLLLATAFRVHTREL